jgi:hypothetical protein
MQAAAHAIIRATAAEMQPDGFFQSWRNNWRIVHLFLSGVGGIAHQPHSYLRRIAALLHLLNSDSAVSAALADVDLLLAKHDAAVE